MVRTPPLGDEWVALFAETNDLRRAAGQVLWYLHRCCVFWMGRERPFAAVVSAWAPAAGDGMRSMENRLRRLAPQERDERLRRIAASVFARLAEDLRRGDGMLVPFARWLETTFPSLTALMKEEAAGRKLHDLALARDLRILFQWLSIASAAEMPDLLARAADDLVRTT